MTLLLNPHIGRASLWFAKGSSSFLSTDPPHPRSGQGILQSTPLLEVELGPGAGPAPRSPHSSHAEGPAGSVRLSRPQVSPSFEASAPCLGHKAPPRLQHAQDDAGEEGWPGCRGNGGRSFAELPSSRPLPTLRCPGRHPVPAGPAGGVTRRGDGHQGVSGPGHSPLPTPRPRRSSDRFLRLEGGCQARLHPTDKGAHGTSGPRAPEATQTSHHVDNHNKITGAPGRQPAPGPYTCSLTASGRGWVTPSYRQGPRGSEALGALPRPHRPRASRALAPCGPEPFILVQRPSWRLGGPRGQRPGSGLRGSWLMGGGSPLGPQPARPENQEFDLEFLQDPSLGRDVHHVSRSLRGLVPTPRLAELTVAGCPSAPHLQAAGSACVLWQECLSSPGTRPLDRGQRTPLGNPAGPPQRQPQGRSHREH